MLDRRCNTIIKATFDTLKYSNTRILAEYFGEETIAEGGLVKFEPGEKAHQDKHTHQVNEVLMIIQGTGMVRINETEYPLKTGEVIAVESGEDHRTQSSIENPLVVAWFVMEK